MEDLRLGEAILASLFTALLHLPPTPPGLRLSLERMGPLLVQMDILPPILLCIANRLKDLPPGETIPVKLCVLMKLHPTSLGPKPWLGPRQMALATRATLVLPPELVCSMALGLPPMLVPLALVSHKKLKKQQAFLSFAFRCFDWLFLVFIFSFPSLATSSNNSVGAIVGPIVGVLCFLALVIGVAIFFKKEKTGEGFGGVYPGLRISQLQKPFSPSSQSKKSINKDKKKKEAANSDEFISTHTHTKFVTPGGREESKRR